MRDDVEYDHIVKMYFEERVTSAGWADALHQIGRAALSYLSNKPTAITTTTAAAAVAAATLQQQQHQQHIDATSAAKGSTSSGDNVVVDSRRRRSSRYTSEASTTGNNGGFDVAANGTDAMTNNGVQSWTQVGQLGQGSYGVVLKCLELKSGFFFAAKQVTMGAGWGDEPRPAAGKLSNEMQALRREIGLLRVSQFNAVPLPIIPVIPFPPTPPLSSTPYQLEYRKVG